MCKKKKKKKKKKKSVNDMVGVIEYLSIVNFNSR